jgi:hypothetical protein
VDLVIDGSGLLLDNESDDAQTGGTCFSTAMVVPGDALGELGLLVKVVPAKFDVAIAEVFNKLVSSSFNISHKVELRGREDERIQEKSMIGGRTSRHNNNAR